MRISDWSSDVCSSDLVLVAREVQGTGLGAGGDQEAIGVVAGAIDVDLPLGGEARRAVECLDAVAAQAALHVLRHRVGEAVLVSHQVAPIDRPAGSSPALSLH